MTDDLTDALLQRVARDYVDALLPDELDAHIAAGTDTTTPPPDAARRHSTHISRRRTDMTMTTPTDSVDHAEFLNDVRARLGVTAEANEETILAALDDRLAAQTRAYVPGLVPEGTVLVDKAQWDEAVASAAKLKGIRAEQAVVRRDALIADALREGRISPDNSEVYRQMLDTDEERTARLLAALQPNSAVLVSKHTDATDLEG